MKQTIIVILALSLMACAHATPFQTCSLDDKWKDYGSMEECISETKAARAAKKQAWADAWKPMQNGNKSMTCTKSPYSNQMNCN